MSSKSDSIYSSTSCPPATPKGKEKAVDAKSVSGWHRVFYKPHQVERSLRVEDFKVGIRLAVLDQREDFHTEIPEPVFYTGVVEKIWGSNPDNQIVTIKYDGHPRSLGISFVIKQYYLLCIPVPSGHTAVKKQNRHKAKSWKRDI